LALIHLSGAFFGQTRYDRGQRLRSLERRAERAEAELETRTQLAVVDERTRIAREMHDVVSHSMSVMVVQASAAQRVITSNPDAAKEALAAIETTGRESLIEMRRMLGVLRDADTETELSPQPELTNFEALSQHCRDSGIPTEVTVIGDEISLSPGLRLASYRVIQEALTNVIKHAGRATLVNVKVEYGTNSLVISVADNGLGAATALTSDGAGHGIIGMRERVALYDGTFSAGPLDGGGYVVNASFPYEVPRDDRVARHQAKNPFTRTDQSA
jgi:signal transduction histidine kinase